MTTAVRNNWQAKELSSVEDDSMQHNILQRACMYRAWHLSSCHNIWDSQCHLSAHAQVYMP